MDDMSLFNVIDRQIRKVKNNSDSIASSVKMLKRLFQIHGEDWDSSTLEKCVRGVYIKSGSTTQEEFQDYIELQLTFL